MAPAKEKTTAAIAPKATTQTALEVDVIKQYPGPQQVQRAVKVNVPGKRQAGCGAAAGARMGDEVVQEGAGALRHQGVLSWTRGDAGMSSGRCRVYWHMALSPSAWDFCHQTCVV